MLTKMAWFSVEIVSITHVQNVDGIRMPLFRKPDFPLA